MAKTRATPVEIIEGGSFVALDRIVDYGGEPIVRASLSGAGDAITVEVWDVDAQPPAKTAGPIDVNKAVAVFDSLQTEADDPRWTEDERGYNFRHVMPVSAFPHGGRYQVQYVFKDSEGRTWPRLYEARVLETYG